MKQPNYHEFIFYTEGGHVHYLGNKALRESKPIVLNSRRRSQPIDNLTEEKQLLGQTCKPKSTTVPEVTSKDGVCRQLPKVYGKCKDIIHYGRNSTVRMHRRASNELYAVKVTHNFHNSRSANIFNHKHNIICRHVNLNHNNLVRIHDSFTVPQGDTYLIMDYCQGHDLHSLFLKLTTRQLCRQEADCFFKQIIKGIGWLHSQDMAHCNLAPGNILLTSSGCVKITALETLIPCFTLRQQTGDLKFPQVQPFNIPRTYLPPEHFSSTRYDLRPGDAWAAGLIYLLMRTGRLYWTAANEKEDPRYGDYRTRRDREAFDPIESMGQVSLYH
jgi:protein-serine/threonine kinase